MKKYHILIVDDDEIVANSLKDSLDLLDIYATTMVHNGEDAIKAVKSNSFDAYLVDQRMPIMSGIEFIKKLIKYDDDPLIYIITAEDDGVALKAAEDPLSELPIHKYIPKPWPNSLFSVDLREDLQDRDLKKDLLKTLEKFSIKQRAIQKELIDAKDNLIKKEEQANSDIKKIMEKLKNSNEELEQFAYIVSHDLQEPLRMVLNYLNQLNKDYNANLDNKAKQYLNNALNGIHRMQTLITKLLTFAKIQTDENYCAPVSCDLIVENVLKNIQLLIDESKAKIIKDPLPIITANNSHILQLFQNLISNAIIFSKDKIPEIVISASREDNKWLFSIKDNGIGFKNKDSKKIFFIFNSLQQNKDVPASGMGLAICKKIVKYHGGEIWAESRENMGSIFYFTIPDNKSTNLPPENKGN